MSGRYLKTKRRRKVCESKVLYWDEQQARNAAFSLRHAKGVNATIYPCPGRRGQRRHWHVTSGRW